MTHTVSNNDIERLLSKWSNEKGPGCAIAVLRGGKVETTACLGLANIEHRVPIRGDTVFRIASITKQFLCAAILLLADEGRIDIDAPLGTYLPELQGTPAAATLRQAMQNATGIRDHIELVLLSGGGIDVPHRISESFRVSARQTKTNFAPGSSFLYSNANFLLLTLIVERITGRGLAELLDEAFFRPLGMVNTRMVSGYHHVIDNMATGYLTRPDGVFEKGQMAMTLSGEGGMVSTLDDMIRWLQYYREDPLSLIRRQSVSTRFTNGTQGHYGFGLICENYRGLHTVGHSGLWPGYRSEIIWFPEPDVSIACLANVNAIDPYTTTRALADLAIGNDFPHGAKPKLSSALRQSAVAASPYLDPDALELVELVDDNDIGLASILHGARTGVFIQAPERIGFCRPSCEYAGVDLSKSPEGTIAVSVVNGDILTLTSAAKLPKPASKLGEFAGRYATDDLDAEILIACDAGALKGEIRGRYVDGPLWSLTPRSGDIMTMDETSSQLPRRLVVRFERDSDGRIVGLVVNGARSKRISYRKVPD